MNDEYDVYLKVKESNFLAENHRWIENMNGNKDKYRL